MRKLCVSLVMLAMLMTVVGCGSAQGKKDSKLSSAGGKKGPYKIVTTCAMVTDIVKIVAGDKAEVVGLMGENVDPHTFTPTSAHVRELMSSDVIFYVGLLLEGRMADTFTRVGRSKKVYAVTEELDRKRLRETAEFHDHFDPHAWMDVSLWSKCSEFVAKSLSEFDPANAQYYDKNVKAYVERLKKLDDYARTSLATIPDDSRVLVTAHDAFGYFAIAYKLEVLSVQGLSTESEASLRDINKLVKKIHNRKIRAVFVEKSVSSKNIDAVIEGVHKLGFKVKRGGSLFSDSMGKPGTYEGTYEGMIDHNVTLITRTLGGKAPVKGLNGKLTLVEEEEAKK